MAANPFRFGALALDESFADREAEVRELARDVANGQDVVLFAPRRYGKTSLVRRVAEVVGGRRVLVTQVDLMTTPTKERLAAKLAQAIHEDIAGPLVRARERLRVFAGLRITPVVTVDPQTGALGFSFAAAAREEDVDATLEQLFALPGELAAERARRVALVLDEFQEVTSIDRRLPNIMRSVFQAQPEVAHVYLGSKRHLLELLFNDENEPFWRSAKQMEIGVIPPSLFAEHVGRLFEATGKRIPRETLDAALELTGGHPYATQELCYFLWEETPARGKATAERLEIALGAVLRSEHSHFSLVWEGTTAAQKVALQALAAEVGRPFSGEYRGRHRLPGVSSTQRALEALVRADLVTAERGLYRIAEPFLAEWVRRAAA